MIESHGKSASLLKQNSKRKRRRDEIEEVKEEEKMLNENRQQFLKEHKRLRANQGPNNEEMEYLFSAKDTLEELINQGVLDKRG